MNYRVTWTIDVDEESFEDAAKRALEIHRNPESIATHFIVEDSAGNKHEIWADEIGRESAEADGVRVD
jgi:hypothetical protein